MRRRPPLWSLVLAAVLHVATLPLYAASGLLAPGWAVLGLLALWAVLAAALLPVHRRGGPVALLVPLVAAGAWFGLLTVGEKLLGWTG